MNDCCKIVDNLKKGINENNNKMNYLLVMKVLKLEKQLNIVLEKLYFLEQENKKLKQ